LGAERTRMMNYKMLIQYDGTRYDGWQKQGNTGNTIQGKLEDILQKMTGEYVEIHGSGRTDAGVHSIGQTANFRLNKEMDGNEIYQYVNKYLPEDIAVIKIEQADQRFHARLNAKGKTYRYRIGTSPATSVFEQRFIYHTGRTYHVAEMRRAAEFLLGTHDFKSFCSNKRMKKSTVRTIDKIDIVELDGELRIDISGDGFLYHMVRILVGTLLEIGEDLRTAEEIPYILSGLNRELAGKTAPAKGLTLLEVRY